MPKPLKHLSSSLALAKKQQASAAAASAVVGEESNPSTSKGVFAKLRRHNRSASVGDDATVNDKAVERPRQKINLASTTFRKAAYRADSFDSNNSIEPDDSRLNVPPTYGDRNGRKDGPVRRLNTRKAGSEGQIPTDIILGTARDSDDSQASFTTARQAPSISKISWDDIGDTDVALILSAYRGKDIWSLPSELAANDGSPSPSDSGVAYPDYVDGRNGYRGKGKARARHSPPTAEDIQFAKDTYREWREEAHTDEFMLANRLANHRVDSLLQRLEEKQQRLEEEQRAAAERLARMKECTVCGDSKDVDGYPEEAPTRLCKHRPLTCKECLQAWMASEFETKGVDGIKCPECPATLGYADVQRAASAETFDAYDRISTQNALSALDDFAWCLGPNCNNGQLNPENNNFMDCASCGYKQCLKHKVPWHRGETCEQYEYRTSGQKARDEEAQTEAMLDGVSKKCPGKNCGWRIQKTDGCDHMTCRKCKHEFCWQCLAAQADIRKQGNTAHETWCKFHSDNLEIAWPFNMH